MTASHPTVDHEPLAEMPAVRDVLDTVRALRVLGVRRAAYNLAPAGQPADPARRCGTCW